MRKSGLQKQISSIFNEAPVPVTDVEPTLPLQAAAAETANVSQAASQTIMTDAPKPSLTQRMAEAATEAVHTPAAPAMRPRPLDRTQAKAKASAAVKKTAAARPKMDAHQKKMTVMVGVLSVVFAVVLFVSLGGLGQSQASPANRADPGQTTQATVADAAPLQWQSPRPLPEKLRDPMKAAPKIMTAESSTDGTTQTGELVVKGIVFSKTRPTALVNDKIVAQGQSVSGTTIVAITKDSVEFEKDGKRWTQTVQR